MSSQAVSVVPTASTTTAAVATKVSFSFGASNTKKPQLAAPSALARRSEDGSQPSGPLTSDGSTSFQSLSAIASASASPSTVPLVIPLKQSTSWRGRASTAARAAAASPALTDGADASSAATSSAPLTLQEQAEQQLLAAAHPSNDSATTALPAELYTTRSIPLQQQQTAQRTTHALDPAPLPATGAAAADEPKYVIPLEEYGVALLRGMGWKGPGDAVGGANKADVQPMWMERREERMGLGADTAAKQDNQLLPHQRTAKQTDGSKAAVAVAKETSAAVDRRQSAAAALRAKVGSRVLALASQQLRVNALVYIAAGRHRRQYGRVREMTQRMKREERDERERQDEDKRYRLEVKLNSGERVSVDSEDVDVLDERALPDDHPAFGTVNREEQESREREQQHERRETGGSSQSSRRNQYDDRPEKRHKPSHSHTSSDSAHPSSARSSAPRHASPSRSHSSGRPVWCAPELRVRIVSRSLASGSYFRFKARVVDVPAASTIQLLLNDGRTVTASEQQLESVVPSEKGGSVQVVRGELKGQVGELIERDSKRGVAIVQLEDDLQLHTLDFDDICERVR